MEELLEQLRKARQEELKALELVRKCEEELKNTVEYDLLQNAKEYLEQRKEFLHVVDEEVRQYATRLYGLTGNKHPHEKVSIVINRTLHYQESEAFDWVGKNAPSMLMLNKKKFEKHARAVLETIPLAFVEVEEVPSVRIAGEL